MIHLIKKMAFAMYLLLAGKIFRDPAALAPLARFRHLYYRTLYHQLLVELHEAVSRISPALSARLLDRRVMKHADVLKAEARLYGREDAKGNVGETVLPNTEHFFQVMPVLHRSYLEGSVSQSA